MRSTLLKNSQTRRVLQPKAKSRSARKTSLTDKYKKLRYLTGSRMNLLGTFLGTPILENKMPSACGKNNWY